jgi:hypothetical protein
MEQLIQDFRLFTLKIREAFRRFHFSFLIRLFNRELHESFKYNLILHLSFYTQSPHASSAAYDLGRQDQCIPGTDRFPETNLIEA